ncbi:MAG: lysoplasmalogenase [Burkholderiaceae bacterium]
MADHTAGGRVGTLGGISAGVISPAGADGAGGRAGHGHQRHGLAALALAVQTLTMVIAIIFVAYSARQISAGGQFSSKSWGLLVAALVGSLAGDAFLMVEGFFIPGPVSFLLAHLAYIALFKQGVHWFAHRGALAATVGVGAAMYLFLWQGGLPPELRVPVAVYVLVIALMAAQALGRARTLGDRAAHQVALGACIFMLSDALLATNRFVLPLPLAQVGVLTTYYAAQAFIVHGTVRGLLAGRQSV